MLNRAFELRFLNRKGPALSTQKDQILNFKKSLDGISQSVCLAKWYHVTLYLHQGLNHSCYHPHPHKITKDDIKGNPSGLHNTAEKKIARQEMLSGQRPKECQYCWAVEDLESKDHISDRLIKSFEQSQPRPELFEKLKTVDENENIIPTVVEISFSNVCNFKCLYCNPKASSKWQAEIDQYGPYQDVRNNYKNPTDIIQDEEKNIYVKAWKKWWPQIKNEINALRITGGEPLLHQTTFLTLSSLIDEPAPQLELMVNSNLGVPEKLVAKFSGEVKNLIQGKKIGGFKLYTSLESTGAEAEYVRFGLNVEKWLKNLDLFMKTVPQANVSIMTTYNVLSVVGFEKFLKLVLKLRKKYSKKSRRIELDISHLVEPPHLLMTMLPNHYIQYIDSCIEFMQANFSDSDPTLFDSVEIGKLRRIRDYFQVHCMNEIERLRHKQELIRFLKQVDARRKTNYKKTFRKMSDFFSE